MGTLVNKYQADGSSYELSLEKLTGQKIKDVLGYVSMEFGEPSFQLTKIVLENGTQFWCEGEHDHPYITDGTGDKLDEYLLQSIHDEENPEEED